MNSDKDQLESVLRRVLHQGDIAEPDLIRPTLTPRATRRRARVALLAAASVVAVVALAVGLLAIGGDSPRRHVAVGDPLAGIVGYRWRVEQLVDDQGATAVPSSLRAEIGFTRDGHVLGDDTINALQANYTPTGSGYTVHDAGSTLVGSGNRLHPIQARTVRAVDALFLQTVDANQPPPAVTVTAALSDQGLLTLRHAGIRLTLTRAGAQPDFPAGSRTPTATLETPTLTARLVLDHTTVPANGAPIHGQLVLTNNTGKPITITDACNGWYEVGLSRDGIQRFTPGFGQVACSSEQLAVGVTRRTVQISTTYEQCAQPGGTTAGTPPTPRCIGPNHATQPTLPPGQYITAVGFRGFATKQPSVPAVSVTLTTP